MQLFQGANMFQYFHLWIVCTYIFDPLPCYSDVFTYLIAVDNSNIIHKETPKQEILIWMEVDYTQEFLNQNPTLLIDGNFEHIVGWKVCD